MDIDVAFQVRKIAAEIKKVSPEEITLEQPIEEICETSIDLISFLFELEDVFNISIPDEAKTPKTIGQVIDEIKAQLETQKDTQEA